MRVVSFLGPVLLMLAGCTLIPTYHRPALPVSQTWPTGPAFPDPDPAQGALAASDIGWQQFFTDPILRQLIDLALLNNRDLLVAIGNVRSAEASYRVSRASLFPTVDANGTATYEREPPAASGGFGVLHINDYDLGLSAASYEIDLFGKLRSQAEQARQNFLGLRETQQSTRISLIAEVASEYLAWLADREALLVSQQTAQAQKHSYDLRVLSLRHGSGTELDVAQAESTLRTAEASLAQYTRQVAQDEDQIVLLSGTPLSAELLARTKAPATIDTAPPFPELPEGLPSDLLQRRPDIRAAEHQLLAANANIGAARAAFFPSITLTAQGGTGSGTLGSLFAANTAAWLFQPQITLPIFTGGANVAQLDIARVQKRIEIADYEKTIQSAFHDVSDAIAARATYASQLVAEQRLVAADQHYYTLSKMRFEAGVDNYLNVLVAQNSLFSAQLNLISLRLAERQNLVTLYKDLGGGWKA